MNKYKLALDKLKNYSIGEALRCEEILKELVNEKLEQESRKEKLIVGSEWVCVINNKAQQFGNYKPYVENIKKGLIVEVFDVNGLIIFGHDKSMESWVVGEEQFLACFRPLKEGE